MTTRTLKVSKLKYNDSFVPKIRLNGLWLNELGFSSRAQFLLDYSMEHLKLRLFDSNKAFEKESSFKSLVSTSSGGRSSDGKIRIVPCVKLYGIWLSEIGFKIEDKVIVNSDYGVIEIILLKP